MLVAVFIHLQILLELREVPLKLLDPLPIFKLLGHELFGKLLHVGCLHLLVDEGKVLLVEFEVSLRKFHKEEVVIVDKGGQSGLSI